MWHSATSAIKEKKNILDKEIMKISLKHTFKKKEKQKQKQNKTKNRSVAS